MRKILLQVFLEPTYLLEAPGPEQDQMRDLQRRTLSLPEEGACPQKSQHTSEVPDLPQAFPSRIDHEAYEATTLLSLCIIDEGERKLLVWRETHFVRAFQERESLLDSAPE